MRLRHGASAWANGNGHGFRVSFVSYRYMNVYYISILSSVLLTLSVTTSLTPYIHYAICKRINVHGLACHRRLRLLLQQTRRESASDRAASALGLWPVTPTKAPRPGRGRAQPERDLRFAADLDRRSFPGVLDLDFPPFFDLDLDRLRPRPLAPPDLLAAGVSSSPMLGSGGRIWIPAFCSNDSSSMRRSMCAQLGRRV